MPRVQISIQRAKDIFVALRSRRGMFERDFLTTSRKPHLHNCFSNFDVYVDMKTGKNTIFLYTNTYGAVKRAP